MGYNNQGWYGQCKKRGDKPKNLGELSERDVINVMITIQGTMSTLSEFISMGIHGGEAVSISNNILINLLPLPPLPQRVAERGQRLPNTIVQS